ncbi:MAG TPA: T9SS type A sorting domain-containing protein [Bacteroidia bacterium]|jgi:hypothetical protein|nr:T9SS type A sorting domain-containing protein [Bacteroidia bacterium]
MKKLLLSLFSLLLLNSANAQQWLPQTAPTTSNNLYSVFAISPTAVGATGVTGPIRTTNAGVTWSQNLILTGVNTYELHTKNPAKWYIMCQNSNWFVKMGNPSGVSLNGGKPDSILSLHFKDLACVVAVGTAGKIEASCDTGLTWQVRAPATGSNLNAIWFSDNDSACAVGQGGIIKRTKDAGLTWNTIPSGTPFPLNGIHFPSSTVGFIVGNGGKILKTTNAGQTWTIMPSGVLNALNGVFFIDKDTGYVAGSNGLIMKTIDGAATWTTMTTGVTQALNSIHFATQVDGWAVGNAGTILKYNGSGGLGINNSNADTHFSFFPNPAKDFITVTAPVRTASIKLFTSLGQLVYEGTAKDEETKIDISNFDQGIYFIECRTEDNVTVKRFVKE